MSQPVDANLNPFSLPADGRSMRWVQPSSVIDLLELTHAEDCIEAYRKEMADGSRFPPVAVVRLGRKLFLADGHKRLAAARQLEIETIPVEIWGLRRLLRDQSRQLKKNVGKNRRIFRHLLTDPKTAWSLFSPTLAHWQRVLKNICRRAANHRSPSQRAIPGRTPDPEPRQETAGDQTASKTAPTI